MHAEQRLVKKIFIVAAVLTVVSCIVCLTPRLLNRIDKYTNEYTEKQQQELKMAQNKMNDGYAIYIDGSKVERVDLRMYTYSIDDEAKEIYCTAKAGTSQIPFGFKVGILCGLLTLIFFGRRE